MQAELCSFAALKVWVVRYTFQNYLENILEAAKLWWAQCKEPYSQIYQFNVLISEQSL